MSISPAARSLGNGSGRMSRAKELTHGSNTKSSKSMTHSGTDEQEKADASKVNRMPRKVFSSTAHNSNNFISFPTVFSPISSEENFPSNENENTSNTENLSSPVQLLSPRTKEAFDENLEMNSL